MAPAISDFKVYMPAKDFAQSKAFYRALGFAESEGFGGTADFTLNGRTFRLQDYYVKEWAENWMVVIDIDDAEAWHQHVKALGNIRFKPPEKVGDALVLHVWDPSGVLLVFVE